jgi:flagellar hook-associated protein 1 FlgK
MSSLFGLLNIAQNGLAAQTAALDATGQNVANVSTPGYSRVTANLETTATGDTFSGSVQVSGVVRSFNQFTYGSMLSEQGQSGAADARSQALQNTQAIVAPSDGTIGDQLTSFFSSLSALASTPSDPSARSAVLSNATSLAQSISSTAAGLSSESSDLLTQAQGVATQVNTQLQQIAQLNAQIDSSQGGGQQPTDMLDQRDALASQVSTEVGAQVLVDSSGNYTLLSGGTALVSGSSAATLAVGLDASGNLKVTSTQGTGVTDITSATNSGTLGGLLETSNTDIPNYQSQLDQFSYDLATKVNSTFSSGYGLDGVTGRNLFVQPASVSGAAYGFAVDPSVANDPDAVAASSTAAGLPGGNDVATALAGLASEPLGSATSPATGFAAIAANVGEDVSSAESESTLRDDTVTQAQDLNQSASGVSIDQEETNLTAFQRAYEASTQVLQTASTLLQDLMQIQIGTA